jgi:hypothetical protein
MFLIVADNRWDVREDGDFMTLRCTHCQEELIYSITAQMSKPQFDAQLRAHSAKHKTRSSTPQEAG